MTYRALDDFVKTRLNPLLSAPGSYYNSILDKDGDSIKGKKLRNSFLIFRSAKKASSLEGVDLD